MIRIKAFRLTGVWHTLSKIVMDPETVEQKSDVAAVTEYHEHP
jgi:hypothetical protein